jgi:predicted TIM-barrel fold metal-dependent hydrolase
MSPSPAILFEYHDGELVDLFATFCNDERLRTTILVDNPARLYGFTAP